MSTSNLHQTLCSALPAAEVYPADYCYSDWSGSCVEIANVLFHVYATDHNGEDLSKPVFVDTYDSKGDLLTPATSNLYGSGQKVVDYLADLQWP